jgi:hypothetical protein
VTTGQSFWSRATLALALCLYGWSMYGLELYLKGAATMDTPLSRFRREIMGRAVVGLGGVAVLAAIILAILGMRQRLPALVTLALAAGWVAAVAAIWPI